MTTSTKQWSIGIYQGDSPFSLSPIAHNPVIQAPHITDLSADFVADPFMLQYMGEWFLFFEILPTSPSSQENLAQTRGVIGLATSKDGLDWQYQGTVLQEPWHLSYPYIFESQGVQYMLPETLGADCVRLYRADLFPHKWTLVADLLPGRHADATPFYYQQQWWMFSCATPEQHDTLELHYATDLTGPWLAHPCNPIIENNPRTARPAGRVIQWQGKLFRFAQDCYPRYGSQVRVFEISELTANRYVEQEYQQSPLLSPTGHGWNGRNMHHIDLHQLCSGQWLACVDGYYHN